MGKRVLVLSINDREAQAIAELAEAKNCTVIDLKLGWGERLDPASEALAPLANADSVILVETPHPAFEDSLRAQGKTVEVIDHHLYLDNAGRLLDRRNPRSSLEQVAGLLKALPLDEVQQRISANDRDFIPGLARILSNPGGANYDTLLALRCEDLNLRLKGEADAKLAAARMWVEGAEAAKRLAVLDTKREVKDDPRLILAHVPDVHADCLADALYLWWHHRDPAKPRLTEPLEFLAVFHSGTDPAGPVTGLMFSGCENRLPLIRSLLEAPDTPGSRLTRWVGGGSISCFFCVHDDLGGEEKAVHELANRLLDNILTGNRPVASWRSHFLQAVKVEKVAGLVPAGTSPWRPDAPSEQHRRYFMAHVRDLLVPDEQAPCYQTGAANDRDLHLRSYVWQNPGLALRVSLPPKKSTDDSKLQAEVPIRALRVHLLLDDLAVIEWECYGGMCGHEKLGTIQMPPDDLEYWQKLLNLETYFCTARPEDRVLSTVAQVLDFNATARFCSSPFINPGERADIALLGHDGAVLEPELALGKAISKEEIDGPFQALWKQISGNGLPLKIEKLVFDERARVVAGVVVVGKPPATAIGREQAEEILVRLALVDGYGTSPNYDPAFARQELKAATYGRFTGLGTHYAVTDQSFTLYGYGEFPAKIIVPDHLPGLYRRLFLIATVYAAALNHFALAVSGLSRGDLGRSGEHFRDLRRRFVRFANGLWFKTVSSQLQGRELFDLIRKASPIDREYAEVKAEIERTDELLDAIQTQRWQWIGGGGLVLAVSSGLLGMNLLDDNYLPESGGGRVWLFIGILLLLSAVLWMTWREIPQRWIRRLKQWLCSFLPRF